MTYIEFFDKNAIENFCACLIDVPHRVVLLGDKLSVLQKHAARYRSVLEERGHQVEFICKTVNRNHLQSIVGVLSELAETYEDCVFDLTGGDDLCLVAMGIVSEKYREKHIQMHRINIRGNTVIDCDLDGVTIFRGEMPNLTVEENIRIYGGRVVYEEEKAGSTYRWSIDGEFERDINTMWEICKQDVRLWNIQIGVLAAAERCGTISEDGLATVAEIADVKEELSRFRSKVVFKQAVIGKLLQAGLLSACGQRGQTVRIRYKNEQVKRCLTKAGQALEMKIFSVARSLRTKTGKALYHDVMNGVEIDWDGKLHDSRDIHDTVNEVDIVMMYGAMPIFISCKNGNVDVGELYKLESVAEKFGGKYAVKVLVATAPDSSGGLAEYIRQRAKDMQIRLIEGIGQMDEASLRKMIGNLRF